MLKDPPRFIERTPNPEEPSRGKQSAICPMCVGYELPAEIVAPEGPQAREREGLPDHFYSIPISMLPRHYVEYPPVVAN